MSEKNSSILPDMITPLSDAAQQNIPETMKQADGALSTLVGFFNNVVLYPVKKANLTFKYKLENFEADLEKKIEDVPPENLQVPPTMIAGPTLEALRYTYDEEELREMFENLLAASMDDRKACEVHPAFVEAIKQMAPLDAKILSKLVELRQIRCASINFKIKDSNKVYAKAMPDYFTVELNEFEDPFIVCSSLQNLERLALIRITKGEIVGADYESMKEHPYVKEREKLFKSAAEEFQIKAEKHAIEITNLGGQFAKTCLNVSI